MGFLEVIVIILLILSFVFIWILSSMVARLDALEKITRETITLIGKTAMVNMGLGGKMPLMPSEDKPRENPLVG